MPGPNRRPADRRQRRNRPEEPDLRVLSQIEPPDPPKGLLKATRDWWESFWSSNLPLLLDESVDLSALRRLAQLKDRRERYYRATTKTPMVDGSKGQPVPHPLLRYMASLDSEIRQLEDRFGMSAKARVNLGIETRTAARTLDDLAGELRVDPRLKWIAENAEG